jgi:hypothetical protein
MAVISKTLTGQISNLGDSWDQMLISVGSNTSGVFTGAIAIINEAINEITQYNKELNTASKFKISGSFFEGLIKAGGKISGIPALGALMSTKDINVTAIMAVEKGVTGIVQSTVQGAKSVNDFSTAIAKLKTEGDKLLKGGASQSVKNAFKTVYEDGIKALRDGREAFGREQSKVTTTTDTAGDKKRQAEALKLQKEANESAAKLKTDSGVFAQQMITSLVNFRATVSAEADKKKAGLDFIDPEALDLAVSQSEVAAKAIVDNFAAIKAPLLTPFQNLNLYIKDNILPQLSTSFKTFFDDLLMNGKLSFDTLGQAIKNTFLSVLASEATQGVLKLLGSAGGKSDKGGGLLTGVLGLLKGGKKAGPTIASIAGSTGGFLGTGAALGGGTAGAIGTGTVATGGALLPILAGVAAVAGIASLFKKKQQAPIPQASSTISTSAAGSSQDFGGGRVVFEISGTNLIGVLNRAGAKLQRFGP